MVDVLLAGLGLCEHCGKLLTLQGMSASAMDAEWQCPSCKGKLTHKSFGYASGQGGKVQWVGPEGKWVTQQPTKDFDLGGGWHVCISPPRTSSIDTRV